MTTVDASVRFGTPAGRWVLTAAVLGSGIAFLDSTVVNVALPAISADLGGSVTSVQWVLDAYLVALSSLVLLGGSMGDLYGRRRVFTGGLVGFVAASLLCGAAPTMGALIVARGIQGAAAAFLVPGSLAIISAAFHPDDRARAVGAWSGLAGAASAVGPFVGGWLIDAISWRMIFLINLPFAAVALWIARVHVPETRDPEAHRPDLLGASLATIGIATLTYALIEGPAGGEGVVAATVVGVFAVLAFLTVESRRREPMLPLTIFRNRQFSGANLTTFAVYGGLGGALFLLVLQLQLTLGYSALEAGTALLPFTVLMLLLSARAGALAQRTGPRLPMTMGPVIAGLGLVLMGEIDAGASYVTTVLPAIVVFGLGMTLTVAPLTAAVLAAVDDRHLGIGSGVNNAVARLAGLIAVAALPALAGIDTGAGGTSLASGFPTAMRLSALVCATGGVIALVTVRTQVRVRPTLQSAAIQSCSDPCLVSASTSPD